MSKRLKATLIAGSIIIAIGLILVAVAGIVPGWKFKTLNWNYNEYTTGIDAEITEIDLQFYAGNLTVEYYNESVIKVEYYQSSEYAIKCYVSNGTLHISTSQIRWANFIWRDKFPETKIYLPQSKSLEKKQLNLKLQVNSGSVTFKAGDFGNVEVELNSGSIIMNNLYCNNFNGEINAGILSMDHVECNQYTANVSAGVLNTSRLKCGEVNVDLSVGTANIGIDGKQSDYSIWTSVSAGSCNVQKQNGKTLQSLKVTVSAGSATVTFRG